ncbi:DUF4113 domain-containing protein [Pseudomonas sp. P116]|nr:DUF4113 domain-containing protein [Pseudomonas sp. P9(2020)]MBZ9565093.1 DUF4113 domain-containing protein [Pseudomonas sp. P116]
MEQPPQEGVLRVASVPAEPGWAMRRELLSQTYTTKVSELWTSTKARQQTRTQPTHQLIPAPC